MSVHGAIDVDTNMYVIPNRAAKGRKYACAECQQPVVFRSGDIRAPHFAHFNPNIKCRFYNNSPGESETHKHAKLVLQNWLTEKTPIVFYWQCQNQTDFGTCGTNDDDTEHSIQYVDGDKVVIEYRDPTGKYIADVAIINNDAVRYVIEVAHSHKTLTTCRPEPWFEVKTSDILEAERCNYGSKTVHLENCRIHDTRYCANCRVKKEHWVSAIPILKWKHGQERGWKQDLPCISCNTFVYSPEWIQKRPRQVCKMCLGTDTDNVHQLVNKLIWG